MIWISESEDGAGASQRSKQFNKGIEHRQAYQTGKTRNLESFAEHEWS